MLVQSIGELQRALGESGARLITTVPRRGYRFEATEVPHDRRKARSFRPLRFRWLYGILAPLAVALTVLSLAIYLQSFRRLGLERKAAP